MIVHWDDVAGFDVPAASDPLAGRWRRLADAAGATTLGANRVEVPEGKLMTPPHVHTREEEIFHVLAGSGTLWQDGVTCEVRPGDTVVHRAASQPHTLIGGPGGLDVLVFGPRLISEAGYLPRSRIAWLGGWPVQVAARHPWEVEGELGLPKGEPGERPPNVVAFADVEAEPRRGETVVRMRRSLGRAAGATASGLNHVLVSPGKLGSPPHCHSAEEEVFVVVSGEGTLLLGREAEPDEEHPVREGTVVSRPAGTGVSHAFRAGEGGLAYLAYGPKLSHDICWYPRSQKAFFRGIGVVGRIEPLDYWDGES